jgi:nucleoside-diphosphate-sugar epimerase
LPGNADEDGRDGSRSRTVCQAGDVVRVGITGASGFIGSALVRRHLERGDVVCCLTRRPGRPHAGVRCVEGDLERPDDRLVRFADGLDVLYHCAGEVIDTARMQAVNVDGVRALLSAAAGRIGRWVQLSSAGVYGPHRTGVISEDTEVAPANVYERTKAEADALVIDAGCRQAIASHVVLRPSIVFGAGMSNRSIAHLIRTIERGLFFFVGAPGASANYIHVANVADALVRCGTLPAAAGRTYNLSDWCTIEDFAGAIADALGRARPRLRVPELPIRCAVRLANRLVTLPLTESRVDALVNRSRYAVGRIQQDLQYAPVMSIPAGLAEMVGQGAGA